MSEEKGQANWQYNLAVLGWFLVVVVILGTLTTIIVTAITKTEARETLKGFLVFSSIYFAGSWRIIRGDRERGGIIVLGYVINHVVNGGLVWVPFGLGQIITLRRSVIQKELPDKPERVWTFSDKDGKEKPIPEDQTDKFKLPIRVTFQNTDPRKDPLETGGYPFSQLNEEEENRQGQDPLMERLAVRVTPVMRFCVVDPIRFLKTFRTEEEAKDQLEDIVIAETTAALQVGTYARALSNIVGLGRLITDNVLFRLALDADHELARKDNDRPELIKKVAEYWGIATFSVQIKALGASRTLNNEVQGIAVAMAKKLSAQERAVGISAETAAVYEGQAKGLKAFGEEAKKHQEILAIDAMKQGMKEGTVIIGGDAVMQSLIGTFKAVKKIEEKQGETDQ